MPDADIVKPVMAEALREFFHNEDGQDYDTDDFEPVAASVLRTLRRAGWRLERTDEADLLSHLYDDSGGQTETPGNSEQSDGTARDREEG